VGERAADHAGTDEGDLGAGHGLSPWGQISLRGLAPPALTGKARTARPVARFRFVPFC
jgi:hypothetical protein